MSYNRRQEDKKRSADKRHDKFNKKSSKKHIDKRDDYDTFDDNKYGNDDRKHTSK